MHSHCLRLFILLSNFVLNKAVDYCDFPGFTTTATTSSECNVNNCLCRLQQARDPTAIQRYTYISIEDGCFRVQSCPQLSLTISEPLVCQIEAKHELSFSQSAFNFDSGGNAFDNTKYEPDTSGSGAIYKFPGGLSAGEEISIRYNAAGEENLALGFVIACDGNLYLLPDGNRVGCSLSKDTNGYCLSSCVGSCSFCSPQAEGYAYKSLGDHAPVAQMNNCLILEGIAYYENNDPFDCSGTTEYSSCYGKEDETIIKIRCGIESVFTSRSGGGDNGFSSDGNGSGSEPEQVPSVAMVPTCLIVSVLSIIFYW